MHLAEWTRSVLRLTALWAVAQDEGLFLGPSPIHFILSRDALHRESKDARCCYRSSANRFACSGIGTLAVRRGSGSGGPELTFNGSTPAQIGSA